MRFDFVFCVMHSGRVVSIVSGVGEALQRKGYRVGYFCSDARAKQILEEKGHTAFLSDEFLPEGFTPNASVESIREIEADYNLFSLRDFYLPEHAMWDKPCSALVPKSLSAFRKADNFFDLHEVRCFVTFLGGQTLARALYFCALRRKIPTLFFNASPFRGRLCFHPDEMGLWLKGMRFYPDLPLKPEEEREAEQILESCRSRRKMLVSSRGIREFLVHPLGWWKWAVRDPLLYSRDYEARFGYSYFKNLRRMFMRKLRTWTTLLYQSQPDWQKEYVFFPLHYPSDVAMTVMSTPYEDPDSLISYISRYLPHGVSLYVKEHPYAIGSTPLRHWRRFKRLGNVFVLPSGTHSYDIIERAKAVVVINSTVGFEALFYNKPVVVVGRTYFRGFGVTYDVDSLYDLPQALQAALKGPAMDREKTKRFIYHVWKETYPGNIFGDPALLNFDSLAGNLLDFIKRKQLLKI